VLGAGRAAAAFGGGRQTLIGQGR